MKRYVIAVLLLFSCISAYSQSIGLLDMINLTSLKPEQVENYFVAGRVFQLQFGETVDGMLVKHYQSAGKTPKQETVLTGAGVKTASGDVLHTVSYVTSDPQNIINLIGQTKSVNLKLTFQGADAVNNIYIYDNFLYHVVIKLNFTQTVGSVDITQKYTF